MITNNYSIEKVLTFLEKRLPQTESHEGFLLMLLFRRKWLITFYPEKEEYFRKTFPADQICFMKFVLLSSEKEKWDFKIRHMLSIFSPEFSKPKILKGNIFQSADLHREYPEAFSLYITYEPRDILKATKHLVVEASRAFIYGNYNENFFLHFDYEWLSAIHKSKRSSGEKFVLVDLDLENVENNSLHSFVHALADLFAPVRGNVYYACTTPTSGIHILLRVDKPVQEFVFKGKKNVESECKNIASSYGFGLKELSVQTGQCLTHVPGVNPYVKDITDIFRSESHGES